MYTFKLGLPFFPVLLRQLLARKGVKQFPKRRTKNPFCATGKERNKEILINDLFSHIIDSYSSTNFLTDNKERQNRRLDKIDVPCQLTDFNIYIESLRKKVDV